jgi:voltage-gated potassium channel
MSRTELPRLQAELTRKPLTPGRAARIIVVATALVTIAGGVLIWILDHKEFQTLGDGLWWSLQTVTTVGYGDIVPRNTGGKIIGAFVMLQGIGMITVIAAAVSASLIEQVRRRRGLAEDPELAARLESIDARLTAIEKAMTGRRED